MKPLQQYRIPFTGLKSGKHQFEFDIDEKFFNEFEYSLVKSGNLKIELELDKQETMLILNFVIKGEVFLSCDVCLAQYATPVDVKERQIAKFGEKDPEEEAEDIIFLPKQDHEIDISNLVYEYLNLAVPYINRCDDPGNLEFCDKAMIEKLKKLSYKEEETSVDPRWDALNKIKNN